MIKKDSTNKQTEEKIFRREKMETIRNYLESMFRTMPNTPEVRRAKDELFQMMEDKYMELLSEGMTENAAVGTVISEFGNLDELSETLGISRFLPVTVENTGAGENSRNDKTDTSYSRPQGATLLLDEVKDYLKADRKACIFTALGVCLCIICFCGPILFSEIGDFFGGGFGDLITLIGVILMFVIAAAGVLLIVYGGKIRKPWKYMSRGECSIDYSTARYLEELIETESPKLSMIRIAGIILCCFAWVPPALLGSIPFMNDFFSNLGAAFLFITAGVGVMLIIFAGGYLTAAKKLLGVNDKETMGGQFTKMQREENKHTAKTGILSVYWPTVTCIYLCWSFLTFHWYKSWIIWPVAGIIHSVIKMNVKAANKE